MQHTHPLKVCVFGPALRGWRASDRQSTSSMIMKMFVHSLSSAGAPSGFPHGSQSAGAVMRRPGGRRTGNHPAVAASGWRGRGGGGRPIRELLRGARAGRAPGGAKRAGNQRPGDEHAVQAQDVATRAPAGAAPQSGSACSRVRRGGARTPRHASGPAIAHTSHARARGHQREPSWAGALCRDAVQTARVLAQRADVHGVRLRGPRAGGQQGGGFGRGRPQASEPAQDGRPAPRGAAGQEGRAPWLPVTPRDLACEPRASAPCSGECGVCRLLYVLLYHQGPQTCGIEKKKWPAHHRV